MGAGQRHLEGGFLQHLGLTHALLQRWQNDKILQGDPAKVQAEKGRALDYVRRQMGLRTPGTEAVPAVNREPAFAWELLSLMQNQADKAKGQSDFHAELAGCWELFKDITALQYAARYENARSLYWAGQKAEARARFMKLHADTAAKDRLPGIDMEFRECLEMQGAEDPWSGLLTKTARAWQSRAGGPAESLAARGGPGRETRHEGAGHGVPGKGPRSGVSQAAGRHRPL